MKSIFDQQTHEEVVNRLEQLTPQSQPTWGKMEVAQMLKHCQFPIKTALKKEPSAKKPGFFTKLFYGLFKESMYNDKLWKQNLPTPKQFKVTNAQDFDQQKKELHHLIDALYEDRNRKERPDHPSFGHFTYTQWGQMQYKHLDHHFRQFGV